jgi:hypothetical protein
MMFSAFLLCLLAARRFFGHLPSEFRRIEYAKKTRNALAVGFENADALVFTSPPSAPVPVVVHSSAAVVSS